LEKVLIIGAGPAGLFAAKELSKELYDVTVIDKTSKVGGGGLNIDGKLNYNPKVGGDLYEFLPEEEAWNVIDDIKKTLCRFSKPDIYYNPSKLDELGRKSIRSGIEFVKIEQHHIGSDQLRDVMNRFKDYLESTGVKFRLNTEAQDLVAESNLIKEVITNNGKIECDYLILAPGRNEGEFWLKNQCDKLGINLRFNPLDVGIRVEVKNEVFDEIVNYYECHDPKFRMRPPPYEDLVRTFCVCYGGYVTTDFYGKGLYGVNGHSYSRENSKSENTNFALLATVDLTEPKEDTIEYGYSIANQAKKLAGERPIIQRLGDLMSGHRSTWDRIKRSYVKPTLKDATPGDISMALPYRIMQDLIKALEMLDGVVPGVNSLSTIAYGPEIKFSALRPETNHVLQTYIKNVSVAGDGAGVSRGVVPAAATGIIAAKGISGTKF